jgi:hypothetical protein
LSPIIAAAGGCCVAIDAERHLQAGHDMQATDATFNNEVLMSDKPIPSVLLGRVERSLPHGYAHPRANRQ